MREHSLKLFRRRVRLDEGMYKFCNSVFDEWNGLAEDVAMAGSLVTFKAKHDHLLRNIKGVCLSVSFSHVYRHP